MVIGTNEQRLTDDEGRVTNIEETSPHANARTRDAAQRAWELNSQNYAQAALADS